MQHNLTVPNRFLQIWIFFASFRKSILIAVSFGLLLRAVKLRFRAALEPQNRSTLFNCSSKLQLNSPLTTLKLILFVSPLIANYTIPSEAEDSPFKEIIFTDLNREEATKLVESYNKVRIKCKQPYLLSYFCFVLEPCCNIFSH